MALFSIDEEKCLKCGACMDACPGRIVYQASEDDYPAPVPSLVEFCLACGHCLAVCPTGALQLEFLAVDQCPVLDKDLAVSPQAAEQFLASRRSIRTFRKKTVDRQTLQKLIEVACQAASAKNQQPWRWVVVQDPAEVQRMAAMVIEWMKIAIPQFPEDERVQGFKRVVAAWDLGLDLVCRKAPHMILAHADKDWLFNVQDCTLALDHLDLYAQGLGLGTCWAGFFNSAANLHPPLNKALGLPKESLACGAMMVGYAKHRYHRIPRRNPPQIDWR